MLIDDVSEYLASNYVLMPKGRVAKQALYVSFIGLLTAEWTKARGEFTYDHMNDDAKVDMKAVNEWTKRNPPPRVTEKAFFTALPLAMSSTFPTAHTSRPRDGAGFGPWTYLGIEPLFPGEEVASAATLATDLAKVLSKAPIHPEHEFDADLAAPIIANWLVSKGLAR